MAETGANYLNVGRSAAGKIWRPRLDKRGENYALQLAQHYGFADNLARVLAGRGVDIKEAEHFLTPTLRRLMPDPDCLLNMEQAAERLARACLRHEKVAVFGDYDVDGACSAALLAQFLTALGVDNRIYIPDRLSEGYGPNAAALTMLAREGATLIITVDCGANSKAALAAAKLAGADIIVLDHHRPAEAQADAAQSTAQNFTDFIHVNPNQPQDNSGLGALCAAGLVFMCLAATARRLRAQNAPNIPDLLPFLDLAALATVCDIVPLTGLNRAFVRQGLKVAQNGHRIGLQALAQAAALNEPLNPYHFGFILGPRLNAGGRIGDSALGAKLLLCGNQAEAEKIAAQLSSLNYGRQEIEAAQLNEALAQIEAEGQGDSAAFIFACGKWHAGIVGLIAARLKERFGRPALAMAEREGGQISGSARSIKGVDIGRLMAQAQSAGVLEKGGGHAMAAGFSLRAENLPEFRAWLEQNLPEIAAEENGILHIDGSLTAGGANRELIEELEKAGPYGAGNPQPLFALPNHKIVHVQEMGRDGAHLRLVLADEQGNKLQAAAFRAAGTDLGQFLRARLGRQIHAVGTLSLNHWRGQTTPQMQLIDAAEVN